MPNDHQDPAPVDVPGMPSEAEVRQPLPAPQQQQHIRVDESKSFACYANFARVTGTPEEMIIDLALNSNPLGAQEQAISVNQRVILNYFTAKRLVAAMQVSLQRHEAVFGVLETNVQKRATPNRK